MTTQWIVRAALCLNLIWVCPVLAITLDTTTSGQSNTSPLTISHTVTASGGNRAIVVVCGFRSDTVVLTATYNGVSMTEVRRDQHPSGTAISSWVFRLVAPATGAHDVVVSHSGGTVGLVCGGVSYTDVNQTTPVGDHDGISASTGTCGTSHDVTLTVAATDVLVDVFARSSGAVTVAQGPDQTEFVNLTSGSAVRVGASHQLGSDGGVMTYTTSSAGSCAHSAVSLQHDAFSAPVTGGAPVWFQ